MAAGASRAPYVASSAKPALSKDDRDELSSLCWSIGKKTGRVTGPGGAVLTRGEMSAFLADYDTDKYPLTSDEKSGLYLGGRCRFEPGRVLCKDAKGKVQALSYLDEASFRRQQSLQQSEVLAERIGAFLAQQPPGKPLSAAALAQIGQISFNITGKKTLPPALAGMISLRAKLPAGALRGDFQSAARDLTRFFDGEESVKDFRKANNFPAVRTGEWGAKASQSYFDGTEAKLGALCAAKTRTILSQNPVGAELMKRFKVNGGAVKLPAFLIGNLGDFDAAAYVPGMDTVVFNRKYILDDPAFNALSNSAKRALYDDSSKMNAWLLVHPAVFDSFIGNNDFTIAHELTHAALDREIPTGPYTQADILENEHEAYTLQMRYMMAQILAHPKASLANSNYEGWMPELQSMLASYNQFLQGIDLQYLSGDSVQAASIPTVKQLVSREESTSSAIGRQVRSLLPKELLKILGLKETSAALGRFESDYQARTKKFMGGDYKNMQSEAEARFPAIAQAALTRSANEPVGAALNDLTGANSLAETALVLNAKDSALFSKIQKAAAHKSLDQLTAARLAKSSAERYHAILYSFQFGQLSNDEKLQIETGDEALSFIDSALARAAAGKGSPEDLKMAGDLAQAIGDDDSAAQVQAALTKLQQGGSHVGPGP